MEVDTVRDRFADVAFTTAVPFTDDRESIRHDAMARNLSKLYDAGARLFIPCGNTGEYYALNHEERIETVRTHVEALADDVVVCGGVAGSLPTVSDLVRGYEEAGADAVMVMEPDHTYAHEDGLVEYYERICDMTDLGVVVYKRSERISRRVISEVSTRENIVAVKFAVDDIKEFSQSVSDVPGDVAWVNGIAERYAVAFDAEGAVGFTTGIGNFVPEATLELFDALQSGDGERTAEIRDLLRPLEDLREEPGSGNAIANANNVPSVKYGMDLAGYAGGPVRTPLVGLTPEDKKRVEECYERIENAEVV